MISSIEWSGGRAACEQRPRYVHVVLEGEIEKLDDLSQYLAFVDRAIAESRATRVLEDARASRRRELRELSAVRDARWQWARAHTAVVQIAHVVGSEAALLQANMRAVATPSRIRAFVESPAAHRWLCGRPTYAGETVRLVPARRDR